LTSGFLASEQAAYLAGLIDGDGYIGILRRRAPRLRVGYAYQAHVEVSSVFEEFLRGIQEMVGSGCWKRMQRGYKSHRPVYHVTFTPNTVRWLLPLLIPHLRLKKAQAIMVLEYLSKVKRGRHGHNPRSDELYMKVKLLNRRGRST